MYAVLLPVMLGAASLGIDTLRVMRAKTKLQNAVDAAVLAAGHARFEGASNQSVQAVADRLIKANLTGTGISPSVRVSTIDNTGAAAGRVTLDAIATLPGSGMGMRLASFQIGAHAAVEAGAGKIEIVLALDSIDRINAGFGSDAYGTVVKNFAAKLMSDQTAQGGNVLKIVAPPFDDHAFDRSEFRNVEWISTGLSPGNRGLGESGNDSGARPLIADILGAASSALDQGSSSGTRVSKKVIVLVAGSEALASIQDENFIGVCDSIKARDISIYTIGAAPQTDVFAANMRECASGPGYYFSSLSASSLGRAFAEIKADSTLLRLAE